MRSLRFIATLCVTASLWTTALAQSSGFDITRMDRTADACEDFNQFANGTWIKNTPIPASQPRWGTFNILAESNRDVLHTILENAAKDPGKPGTSSQLIGDFYASCMDEAAIEAAGTKPIDPLLKDIAKIKTIDDVIREIAQLHKAGYPALFRFNVGPDPGKSTAYIVNAGQGGLTLPSRDYYVKDDAKSVEIRGKFVEYMTNMFKLLGDSPDAAAANAKLVLDMQTRLAQASMPPAELRKTENIYNKVTIANAQSGFSNFSFADYMKARGVTGATDINFTQPLFFKEANTMLADTPVESWKTYLRWMVADSAADLLTKAFRDEQFNFNGLVLAGQKEQQPRWRQCVQSTDQALGEAVGAEFVKVKYTPEAEKRMDELITNLFTAMREHINAVTWMTAETKTKALEKLDAYKRKIGYNKNPRGYAGLKIDRSFGGNSLRISEFNIARNIADLGKPTDRTRWGMTASTVNAGYSPLNNDVTFPAGILQPPFFNFKADDAINYGAIGGGIGHEITHGFDDLGSKFDKDGNLKSWWTAEDRTEFEKRAQCVVDQFNGYEVEPGLNLNGKLTLGENIGDLGGLAIAYSAFQNSLKGKPRPANIDGFTPEQRFFLGWAQVWAAIQTPEITRQLAAVDPHSAAKWRINGPMSNMPEFAQAWDCKQGQKMVREKFCQIW